MLKRGMDVLGASLLLIVLAPVALLVALGVLVALGRPVLFSQTRPGLGGRPFTLWKFRTMLPAPPDTSSEHDELRMTRFGSLLRATSLDEIPELWNVLRGDMSLVGPRPLLMEYLDRYSPRQARRHDVRPGLTGLVQVSGRNALSWEDKLELDVQYVERRSWWLDLKILLLTPLAVVRADGIAAEGYATAPVFAGEAAAPTTVPTP
jgi:lipopolysaccharide/colanic/teichoic acid biosynthesis glycosyltransferase